MKILLVGDVMLGRLVNEHLRHAPPEYPWGDTLDHFRAADLRICNLEFCLSVRGQPWPGKVFHFRSDTKNVATLNAAGIDAVSLANNHILDFGYDAMSDTLETLRAHSIACAGAGANTEEAAQPAIIERGNLKIALVSATDNEPGWRATDNQPGIFWIPIELGDARAAHLFSVVEAAKRQADLVIVALHWGPNWGYRPEPAHIPFAHALIDRGADIIFGHSCHVFQGVEIYKGKPILYSIGDFIDDYAVDPVERNDESFIFEIDLTDRTITGVRLIPTIICEFQARLARGSAARQISQHMLKLCHELHAPVHFNEELNHIEIRI